jgi:hypothetical protein
MRAIISAVLVMALCLATPARGQLYGERGDEIAQLMDNLETVIRTDARHWRTSTYVRGSLRNLDFIRTSSDLRTFRVRGTYDYYGTLRVNRYSDWVEFSFSGRELSCIEYGHERGCRALLAQDRSVLGPALVIGGTIALGIAMSNRPSGSARSGGGSSSGYRGETRSQCEARCNDYPGDANMNAEAAYVAQCRRRCSSLPY